MYLHIYFFSHEIIAQLIVEYFQGNLVSSMPINIMTITPALLSNACLIPLSIPVPYTVLSHSDVHKVLTYVWDFRAKWKYIGLELSIELGTLDAIEKDNSKCEDCLRAVIIQWIHTAKSPPTWIDLDKAMQSKMITGNIVNYIIFFMIDRGT